MKIKLSDAVVDTDFVRFMNEKNKELWIYLSNGNCIVVQLDSELHLSFIKDTLFREDTVDLSKRCCANCNWNIGSDLAEEIQKENSYTDEETLEIEGCCLGKDRYKLNFYCEEWISEDE